MNIQQLEYLIAVDRLKSFTKAAELCNVTQATLSAMVKKLEEELDVVIFDRKTSPILTTDMGHSLIEETNTDSHDAQFMLTTCSAFCNFLINKSKELG